MSDDRSNIPVPDPSLLTTEQLRKLDGVKVC